MRRALPSPGDMPLSLAAAGDAWCTPYGGSSLDFGRPRDLLCSSSAQKATFSICLSIAHTFWQSVAVCPKVPPVNICNM
jgi:hypothetical protein